MFVLILFCLSSEFYPNKNGGLARYPVISLSWPPCREGLRPANIPISLPGTLDIPISQ